MTRKNSSTLRSAAAMAGKRPSGSPATGSLVTLKVVLRHTKPPVWRRLVVADSMTLGDLHRAIQAAMGWHGGHLHAFDIGGTQYGDPGTTDDVADENRLRLSALQKSRVTRFGYTYDFGDDWEHAVTIEKSAPAGEGAPMAVCIAGKRNCPPEDCGGPWGYFRLLEILADKSHPEHAGQREWLDEAFDPEAFSAASASARLGECFKRR